MSLSTHLEPDFYLGHFQYCFFQNLILNQSGILSAVNRPAGNVLWDGEKVCTSKCDSKKLFWSKCRLVINPTVNANNEFPLLGISVASAKHNMLFLKWETQYLANQAPCRWSAIAWYLELCLSCCIQPIQRNNKSWLWPEEPSCIDFLSWFKTHKHTVHGQQMEIYMWANTLAPCQALYLLLSEKPGSGRLNGTMYRMYFRGFQPEYLCCIWIECCL